uniref:Uncharacterized protein n=1 Tax=Romanomermis culicivorax TaxID=13658 RepID=A0A915ITA6_ROMCU
MKLFLQKEENKRNIYNLKIEALKQEIEASKAKRSKCKKLCSAKCMPRTPIFVCIFAIDRMSMVCIHAHMSACIKSYMRCTCHLTTLASNG